MLISERLRSQWSSCWISRCLPTQRGWGMFQAPPIKLWTTHRHFFGSDCHMLCEIPVLWLVVATHVWAPQLLDQDPDNADEKDEVHLRERKREEMGGRICSLSAHWRFSHPRKCKELCSSNKDVMRVFGEEEDEKHRVHVSFLHKTQMVPFRISCLVHFHSDGQNPAVPKTRNCKLALI